MIAMPCYGGVVSDKTAKGLFNLGKELRTAGIDHGLLTMANESLVTKARSRIANFFMNNTEYEYILFIDADIGFTPEDVFKLIVSQKDIVCGAYPMKGIPLRYNYNISKPEVRDGDLIKIDNIGFGFALIHRKVFSSIISKYGEELKYYPPTDNSSYPPTEQEYHNSYHYFLELKKDMSYLPEDFSFFERAKSVGYDAWLNTSIRLAHVGSHVYCEE
jgi:glycosyltransferase involved in cell wall biosynthesis